MPPRPRVYLAGPDVFHRDARKRGEDLKETLSAFGLEGVFPLDKEISEDAARGPALGLEISRANEELIRGCDAVLANLTPFRGPSADPGTVYEVGFARGLGKLLVGYSRVEEPFAERTARWAEEVGLGASQRKDGTWEDGDGLQIETFGLVDNLMIDGGIRASGGRIFVGDESVVRRAAQALAEALT
jgi:nucleoside 2-deoxyribosyltransferase